MALNCGGRPPDTTKSGYFLENSSNNATNEPFNVTTMFAPGSSHMLAAPCFVAGSMHDYTRGVSASMGLHGYHGSSGASHVLQQVGRDHHDQMNGDHQALYMCNNNNNNNNTIQMVDDGMEVVVDEQGYGMLHPSESKKRRLSNEQVKSLEVSFDMESKLEPERKNQLAQELGLQPRQVAVWFQNRRARSKTKQLERDYDILKQQYDAVRSEKDKLQAEVAKLKDLLAGKGTSTPSNDRAQALELQRQHENQDDDLHSLSTSTGAGKQNAASPTSGEQKAKLSHTTTAEVDAFSSDNSDQTQHVHVMVEAASKSPKVVKPSLVAGHLLQQQQQQLHSNLSPTKLSLCSPQQALLHHMIAVKMEEISFNLHEPDYSLYNEDYNFHHIDHDEASEPMLCFNTWHHEP